MEDIIQEDMKQGYYLQLKEQVVVEHLMQQQYKNGKNVYNYIAYADAKAKSEALYTKTQNNVISRLCSGYAWDTALKFIETKYQNYATKGKDDNYYGNYEDVTFTYTAIDGSTKTKNASNDETGILIPTGQTTSVNNIYDMGGNIAELTTGNIINHSNWAIQRGASMSDNSETASGCRLGCGNAQTGNWLGFRITLFL